jgi:signal transduction histidine kinase
MVPRVKPQRLSLEQVEDAALEALLQRGVQLRIYAAPLVFLAAMVVVALDPASWRRWLVLVAFVGASVRVLYELAHARRFGFERKRLFRLVPVPATVLLLVVLMSGGVDSPIFVMAPLVTVFVSLFFRPAYGFLFAGLGTLVVLTALGIAATGALPDFMPEAFGGGPRGSATETMLYTRAAFAVVALWWASLIGLVMRRAYQSAIQRALDARDEVLRTHEASTKTLTTLAAEIAHELKNPLASVKGLAQLVDREVAAPKEKERLGVLRREVDRMQDILEAFLTFSRPVVPLDLGPVQVGELLVEVLALHEGQARERAVTLRLDARPGLTVRADARKVKQVLINLLQNALDVTAPGGAIDLVVGPDGAGVRVSVMDRGPGVADEARAFEPGVTTKPNGSGLGLTVSRLIARQHGGEVRLLAREGGGAVAELTLPEAPP